MCRCFPLVEIGLELHNAVLPTGINSLIPLGTACQKGHISGGHIFSDIKSSTRQRIKLMSCIATVIIAKALMYNTDQNCSMMCC